MVRFRISTDRSEVSIEAKSSLHPITGEAGGLEGTIDVELADGRLDPSVKPEVRIELPVEQLKSGNALYDREMQRRVEARKYPRITGELRDVEELDQKGRYRVRGDLTFHGVTRPAEAEVQVSMPDERCLVIEGEQVFDIRDFGIQPPKILTLRVHPDVRVRARVVAEREE